MKIPIETQREKTKRLGTRKVQRGEPLACLEVINKMGIIGRSIRNKSNMDPLDVEMLDLFEKQFTNALIAFNYMNILNT